MYRQDGTTLFLHPFDNVNKVMDVLEDHDLVGKYGKDPRVESLTLFRNDLYRMIEGAVKTWISEVRFIPRFLLATGVFLITYFFLSYVVRDPLPMIDEILIGLGLAFLTYFLIAKRDQKSSISLKRRVDLRTAVDRIVFEESGFVKEVEAALQAHEAEGPDRIIASLLSNPDSSFGTEDEETAAEMLSYLEKRFAGKEYKKQEKLISRMDQPADSEKEKETLTKLAESGKFDIPLFAVYRRMKRTVNKK